jgi:hypothetical protein
LHFAGSGCWLSHGPSGLVSYIFGIVMTETGAYASDLCSDAAWFLQQDPKTGDHVADRPLSDTAGR